MSTFQDLDEMKEMLNGVGYQLNLTQLKSKTSDHIFFAKKIDSFILQKVYFGAELLDCGLAPSGYYSFHFCNIENNSVVVNGKPLERYTLSIFPPNTEFYSIMNDVKYYCVFIPKDIVNQSLRALDGNNKPLIPKNHISSYSITKKEYEFCMSFFRTIYGENLNEKYLEEKATFFLSYLFTHITHYTFIKEKKSSFKKLNQFMDYVDKNIDSPLNCNTIARHLGVSTRTLERMLKDHLVITPYQYILYFRLNRLHIHLKNVPKNTKVQDVCYGLGFNHLGRVSMYFKSLFNCTPIQILKEK